MRKSGDALGAAQPLPRRWIGQVVAALTTLGVLSAVGAYYVPGLLARGSQVSGRAPLVVDVAAPGDYTSESFFTPIYLFPDGTVKPSQVPRELLGAQRDAVGGYEDWAREHGAIMAQDQTMRLTIRGRGSEPVIVNGLRARVVEREQAVAGWFTHGRGCGGVAIREADIDLDETPPSIRFTGLDGDSPGTERLALTVQVTDTDVEVVDVVAHTYQGRVDWVLEVLYESAGKDGVLVVDSEGQPFVVTALAPGLAQYYREDYETSAMIREASADPAGGPVGMC